MEDSIGERRTEVGRRGAECGREGVGGKRVHPKQRSQHK